MKIFRWLWALICFLMPISCVQLNRVHAEENEGRFDVVSQLLYDPAIHDRNVFRGDDFLDAQARRILDLADKTLIKFPPAIPEPIERKMALLMIDGVLHEEHAASRPSVQQFYHIRMGRVLEELQKTRITEGAIIWKLYNDAFIVRTKTVTLAFDLIRGKLKNMESFALPDSVMEQIIAQCDVLFISHIHHDHADRWVAQTFIDQGKPVVAPPQIWVGKAIYDSITHLNRIAHEIQTLLIHGGQSELRIVNYPGHQGPKIENNVPLVITPEELSFVQTGDQYFEGDFVWIDEVRFHYDVDVVMPNCWTKDVIRLAKGFDPQLVLPGHENELSHAIDYRVPNWLTYDRFKNLEHSMILMTWGEKVVYKQKEKKK